MSFSSLAFLTPWFLLGLLAVGVPVLLHLQRRRSRDEHPFSTLRFLRASPPRLDRRRRVEHWLLLLVRGLVVMLLAAAFARPLFTRPLPGLAAPGGTRRLLLIDTSASMQRSGLWGQVLARARADVAALAARDRLAIMTFADRPHLVLGFDEWAAALPEARAALASARLAARSPGWGGTDLGAALVAAAEVVADDVAVTGGGPAASQSVVLIGDLAEGARLGALGPREWPGDLTLRLERVAPTSLGTNLGLHPVPVPLADAAAAPAALTVRVRVSASPGDGGAVSARLRWEAAGAGDHEAGAGPIELRLAPGESRVVEAPARPNGAGPGTLLLEGDGEIFDNRVVVAPAAPTRAAIVYVGSEAAADATGGLYFLSRAFPSTRARAPEVVAHGPQDAALPAALARADLVVLATALPPGAAVLADLRRYVLRGRTLLFAPPDAAGAQTLSSLLATPLPAWSEAGGREAVLTGIDLAHPLLQAAFADPRSADFTHIRFWHHRLAQVPAAGARVLARFDDGSAAWLTVPAGRGQIFVMTAGFAPRDSQLGLSSKLVPLLFALLDASAGPAADLTPRFVGDSLPMTTTNTGTLVRPDGRRVAVPAGLAGYDDADLPGLYRLEPAGGEPAGSRWYAVNVPPAESATAPLALEALERAGVTITEGGQARQGGRDRGPAAAPPGISPASEALRRAEQLAELEGAQKPWRWVLLAVLALGLAEALLTLRAGRAPRAAGGLP